MIYENAETLEAERSAIDRLGSMWGATAVKLPRRYSIDFAMLRGGTVVAWAEYKQRKNASDKYPTYNVSLFKYLNLLDLSNKTGRAGLIIVEWADCTGYVRLPCEHEIVFSGRQDRGDPEDMEPMVSIPISAFKIVERKNDP